MVVIDKRQYLAGAILLPGLLALVSGAALGGSSTVLKRETVPFAFTKRPVGARDLALGGTSAALLSSPAAVFANPSALGPATRMLFWGDIGTGAEGETDGSIALLVPERTLGALGFGIRYVTVQGIEVRDADTEEPSRTISVSDMELVASLGKEIRDGVFVGGSAKLLREDLDRIQVTVPAFDAGLLYQRSPLRLGFAVRNVGPAAEYRHVSHDLPRSWEVGAGYEVLDGDLLLLAGVHHPAPNEICTRLGMEFEPHDGFFLRGGLALGAGTSDGDAHFFFGLGLSPSDLTFDYGVSPNDEVGNLHRVSMSTPLPPRGVGTPPWGPGLSQAGGVEYPRVLVVPFHNVGAEETVEWLERGVGAMLTVELSNSPDLSIVRTAPVGGGTGPALAVDDPMQAGRQAGADIVITGDFELSEEMLRVDTRLLDVGANELLTSETVTGEMRSLMSIVGDLAGKIQAHLPPPVRSGEDVMAAATAAISIVDAGFIGSLFPAKQKHYVDNPVGSVRLRNDGSESLEEVKVSIFAPGFTRYPTEIVAGPVAPKELTEPIPLNVLLDLEKVLQVAEETPIQIVVRAENVHGQQAVADQLVKALVLHNANAMDWSDQQMIAAFITPNDRLVHAFARRMVSAAMPSELGLLENYMAAAAIHTAMALAPIHYLHDPSTLPVAGRRRRVLDRVQYPRETLMTGAGDCDDMAVLFASSLENIGIRTLIADAPNHVFVLFDSGVLARQRYLLGLEEGEYVERHGMIFLPVETTELAADFATACRKGMAALARWGAGEQLRLIDVAQAWQTYESVSLPGETHRPPDIDPGLLVARVEAELESLNEHRHGWLEARIDALEGQVERRPDDHETRNELGILYALAGRTADARRVFERLVDGFPQYAPARNNLANLLCMSGEFEGAQERFAAAAGADPADGGILFNLGVCLAVERRPDAAVEQFAAALRRFPSSAQARTVMGVDFLADSSADLKGEPAQIPIADLEALILRALQRLERRAQAGASSGSVGGGAEDSPDAQTQAVLGGDGSQSGASSERPAATSGDRPDGMTATQPTVSPVVRMLWTRAEPTGSRDLASVLYWKR